MTGAVLSVRDLRVRIGAREIVRGVGFEVQREQTLGIVCESGSGKTMTVLAATGLLDAPGAVVVGSSTLAGETELVGASPRLLRSVHGGRIGFVWSRRRRRPSRRPRHCFQIRRRLRSDCRLSVSSACAA